ncbi:DUF411 domain-containing protein (plasmid) [Paracoccus yeei]|uniref:DUF411 domain-containing protein n=1 Tax=Paracoccus yeei TaxID=147645 RepID=UPI003BF78DAF
MTHRSNITRRTAILSGLALAAIVAGPGLAQEAAIHVVKGTGCECCNAWITYLRDEGFSVTDEERYGTLLMTYKSEVGVPQRMISCHTGMVDGYVIEGHVPAADIRRLLSERPNAIGLAVPGMPYGSPGMGPESKRKAYEVLLIRRDGLTEVFSSYESA